MSTQIDTPSASAAFDRMYRAPITPWGDFRIPNELKDLVTTANPKTSLELGCGLARFSSYMATQGVEATGVDFSSVAIQKARKRSAHQEKKPVLMVADVTHLDMLDQPFDVAFDVGCFHCLSEEGHQKYASEVYRLLKPGSTLLIWVIDASPASIRITPGYMAGVFGGRFQLAKAEFSRRRLVASHWYWLVREGPAALS